jgi:hypothetical protein
MRSVNIPSPYPSPHRGEGTVRPLPFRDKAEVRVKQLMVPRFIHEGLP